MALKGASPEHEGPSRPDRWALDEELPAVAERWGIDPARDLSRARSRPVRRSEIPARAMSTTGSQIPQISLRDSDAIPQLGFGVFLIPRRETEKVVAQALSVGYRHIDTAALYGNEAEVGQAIHASGLERSEVFVTTKCFNEDHGYEQAKRALSASLKRLQMDYVDLYLIHWPVPARDKYVETWKAFIDARAEGLVRSIGVSNFQPAHLERIVRETGETPAVNQIELHPYLQQRGLRREHEELGIVTEAWSPLARGKSWTTPRSWRSRRPTPRPPDRSRSAGTFRSATW